MIETKTWNPERLFKARRVAGLSQETLAARLTRIMEREAQPIRARSIVRWEKPRGLKGAHAPHADFIPILAEALECPESYFFATEDEDGSDDDEDADPAMREAFELFVDLMDRIRDRRSLIAEARA